MSYPQEKFYITKEGIDNFRQELKKLEELRRIKIKDPEEDQSELIFINQKIGELSKVLKNHALIAPPSKDKQNKVDLGATVTVQVDGEITDLKIVGTLEANPPLGRISNISPVGKALMGREIGEAFIVSSAIKVPYKILKIRY